MTAVPGRVISAVLADVATIGPFFAAEIPERGAPTAGPWRPLSELTRDAESLTARIESVRGALAQSAGRPPEGIEPRVAASVAHLGLVARLLSPALGAAISDGIVPDLALETAWWQPVLGRPFPLCLPASGQRGPRAARALVTGPIRELTGAVAACLNPGMASEPSARRYTFLDGYPPAPPGGQSTS